MTEATNRKRLRWTCGWCLKACLGQQETFVHLGLKTALNIIRCLTHFFSDYHSLGLFLLKPLFSLRYTCSLSVRRSRAERGGERSGYCSHGNHLLIYFSLHTVQKQPGGWNDYFFRQTKAVAKEKMSRSERGKSLNRWTGRLKLNNMSRKNRKKASRTGWW